MPGRGFFGETRDGADFMTNTRWYRYRDDIAPADAAFEAWGATVRDMIIASVDALTGVMVENLDGIHDQVRRTIRVEADTLEMALFRLLDELVYLKDAEGLFLRLDDAVIGDADGRVTIEADARGEPIDPSRHELNTDVKAVTIHRFAVAEENGGWKATVVADT